ncbi:MAG: hemoglobin [Acidobacteriales bacterium]|nr:hemoglobin [Terriglobales bacterium]
MSTPQVSVQTNQTAISPDAYRQLGGMSGITAAVKRFYKEMSYDPVLHPLLRESDLTWLVARQAQFLAQALGAPITYKGPAMKQIHAFMGITERHRWMVERHLADSLARQSIMSAKHSIGMTPRAIKAIVALVEPV